MLTCLARQGEDSSLVGRKTRDKIDVYGSNPVQVMS